MEYEYRYRQTQRAYRRKPFRKKPVSASTSGTPMDNNSVWQMSLMRSGGSTSEVLNAGTRDFYGLCAALSPRDNCYEYHNNKSAHFEMLAGAACMIYLEEYLFEL